MLPLDEVQRRVRDFVVSGDRSAGPLLVGGRDADRRLDIHRRHYEVSLVTAVLGRFPATGWLVGTPLVEEAARRFVHDVPPRAPCIAEYGQAFPEFLAAWRGAGHVPYLREFADFDFHLGRLALSVDLPEVTRADLARVSPDELADFVIAIQPGTHYVHSVWPVDELMTLYLTNTAPDRLTLLETRAWIEVRGSRGSFRFSRLTAAEFAFRSAIADGRSLDEAAGRAWENDARFDPGAALVALVDAGLAASIGRSLPGARR